MSFVPPCPWCGSRLQFCPISQTSCVSRRPPRPGAYVRSIGVADSSAPIGGVFQFMPPASYRPPEMTPGEQIRWAARYLAERFGRIPWEAWKLPRWERIAIEFNAMRGAGDGTD